jgi:hypothetical protein
MIGLPVSWASQSANASPYLSGGIAFSSQYEDWQAELDPPQFNDVVRLKVGDKRAAYVCYAVDDGDKPARLEIVFGLDLEVDVGQWQLRRAWGLDGSV